MYGNYIIRKARPSDAERIIMLLNESGGETDFLTFEKGAIKIPINAEEKYIEDT